MQRGWHSKGFPAIKDPIVAPRFASSCPTRNSMDNDSMVFKQVYFVDFCECACVQVSACVCVCVYQFGVGNQNKEYSISCHLLLCTQALQTVYVLICLNIFVYQLVELGVVSN